MGILLGLSLVAIGALRYGISGGTLPGNHVARLAGSREPVLLEGEVSAEPERVREDLRVVVRVARVTRRSGDVSACGQLLVRFKRFSPGLDYGDRLRLRLVISRPGAVRNPGAFDYRRYLALKGIHAMGTVHRRDQVLSVVHDGGHWFWSGLVIPIRRAVRASVDRHLSGGPGGLLAGVLLGEKRRVPGYVREAFGRAGVNHVLAVSGLHVGLIAASVFFGLRCTGLGRRSTGVATSAALVLYAMVTGFPPSVVRASAMGSVAILGTIGDREGEGLNTLGVAAIGILACRPQDLFDVGFQLSFAATGGILLLHRPLRSVLPGSNAGPLGKWISAPLAVSLAAQASTAPLVIAYFGRISPISLLANLIVVPLMGGAVALGLLMAATHVALPPISMLLSAANWALLKVAILAAECLARPAWASVDVHFPGPVAAGVYVCLLLILVPEVRRHRTGRYLVVLGLVLANVWVWGATWQRTPCLEVLTLDVGQGDAIFLRFPNGRTMLVDGGARELGRDMGERVVLPFLRSRGISRLDAVVATHAHGDHIGGLVSVLEGIEVGTYLDNGQAYGSWTARRVAELIGERGIEHRVVCAGDSLIGLGGVGVVVIHPTHKYVSGKGKAPRGINNGSVVLQVRYGGQGMLLTGDVEKETDGELLRWGDRLRADVLKAAHHGSRTSSSEAFLAGVRPRTVVVSCGAGNRFGHPAPEVIHRLQRKGIRVIRTDRAGAVRVLFSDGRTTVKAWIE